MSVSLFIVVSTVAGRRTTQIVKPRRLDSIYLLSRALLKGFHDAYRRLLSPSAASANSLDVYLERRKEAQVVNIKI